MLRGVGFRNVLLCGACKESVQLSMFSLSVHHMITRAKNFFDYMKQILSLEAFEAFNYCSIFDKAVFCLGEKKGTVNPEIFVYENLRNINFRVKKFS